VTGGSLAGALRGRESKKIAELAYAIDSITRFDGNRTENRSAIPLFSDMFTPRDRYNGSLFRYLREYNGIRDNNGI
jgi:hypothetical protein